MSQSNDKLGQGGAYFAIDFSKCNKVLYWGESDGSCVADVENPSRSLKKLPLDRAIVPGCFGQALLCMLLWV